MPLLTDDIEEARVAYAALERRVAAAEETLALLRQRVASLEGERIELLERLEQLARSRADLPVTGLVGDLGLAASMGEAAMPGRVIGRLGASVRGFVQPEGDGVGVRLPQPEVVAAGAALSTLSLELAKVPGLGAEGVAPRSAYAVLEDKAAVYENRAFRDVDAARAVIAEVVRTLAEAGGWTFASLADSAARIGRLEAQVARAVTRRSRRPEAVEYRATTAALADRAARLARTGRPVAGDVAALCARLDASTRAAAAFTR